VFSIEKSIDVHKLCKLNPWSKKFFEDENIYKIIGDSVEQVKLFEDNFFDTIIHDPPRFSIAGDMYSEEFYLNLNRILKKGGKVFHYIGKPDSKFGLKMFKSIKNRMENCNFSVKIENKRYGLVAKTNKK
jgi:predicted methyltransferase